MSSINMSRLSLTAGSRRGFGRSIGGAFSARAGRWGGGVRKRNAIPPSSDDDKLMMRRRNEAAGSREMLRRALKPPTRRPSLRWVNFRPSPSRLSNMSMAPCSS
ncbi:hypothetical protein LINPERHAP1_LOCUS18497 [Linum perenne]